MTVAVVAVLASSASSSDDLSPMLITRLLITPENWITRIIPRTRTTKRMRIARRPRILFRVPDALLLVVFFYYFAGGNPDDAESNEEDDDGKNFCH